MNTRKLYRVFTFLVLSLMTASLVKAQETYPKREVRGVWITPINGGWPSSANLSDTQRRNEALSILNNLHDSGFNVIFLHVRPYADRIYSRNSYTHDGVKYTVAEPSSRYVYGSRGATLNWSDNDILDYWIAEAHKRGIEVYAWVNPYRTVASGSDVSSESGSRAWVIGSGSANCRFDPGRIETQARVRNVAIVLTGNYDIDGIVFDDYFYPTNTGTADAATYKSYQDNGGALSLEDFRRENVNKTMREVRKWMRAIKPHVRLGVGPAGVAYSGLKDDDGIPSAWNYTNAKYNLTAKAGDNQYSSIYSDPMAWMREKSIDFISPQIYWTDEHRSNSYTALADWWSLAAKTFGVPCFVSTDINPASQWAMDTYNGVGYINFKDNQGCYDIARTQIERNRELTRDGKFGTVIYSSKTLFGGLHNDLKSKVYQNHTLVPVMNGSAGSDPGRVSGLYRDGSTLRWNALSNVRYVVYAVPESVDPVTAASENGGLKAQYIVGNNMYYTNSASISGKTDGYWYAVAPLDRFGNEWEYTTLGNVPPSYDAQVQLVSPNSGATASWKQKFDWTGTEGATFTFELSRDANFSTIEKSQTSIATSVTVDFTDMSAASTYYWHVRVSKNGFRDAMSETRSVTSPSLSPLSPVILKSPADGATATIDQEFTWVDNSDAETFTIEIADDNRFNNILMSNTGYLWSHEFNLKPLDYNKTYYWRVRSARPRYSEAISEVRSFTSPDRPHIGTPSLYYPHMGENMLGDIVFICEDRNADNTLLEVSTSPTFEDGTIIFSGSSRWNDTENVKQYTVPLSMFTDGKYYWRVSMTRDGYYSAVSEVRYFTIGTGSSNNIYIPQRDPADYHNNGNVTFTNLWWRKADNSPWDKIGEPDNMRDMTARAEPDAAGNIRDVVYIADRSRSCLHVFDGRNGCELPNIQLSFDAAYHSQNDLKVNGVLVDASGDLYVYPLGTGRTDFTLGKVDTSTGAVSTVFSHYVSETKNRIDHIDIQGSVASGNYVIWAIGGEGNGDARHSMITRFIVSGGNVRVEYMDSKNGLNPRIYATGDADYCYIDGQLSQLSKVRFDAGSQSPSHVETCYDVQDNLCCGMGRFMHEGDSYLVVAHKAYSTWPGNTWRILKGNFHPSDIDDNTRVFGSSTHYWEFPESGMGMTSPGNAANNHSMPVAIVQYDAQGQITRAASAKSTNIYVYSAANGLGGYTMANRVLTGIESVGDDNEIPGFDIEGTIVKLKSEIDAYSLHDINGRLIESGVRTTQINTPGRGIYVLTLYYRGTVSRHKIAF